MRQRGDRGIARLGVDLARVARLAQGTTVATNTVARAERGTAGRIVRHAGAWRRAVDSLLRA